MWLNCVEKTRKHTSIIALYLKQNFPMFANLITTFSLLPAGLCYVIPMAYFRSDVITPEALRVPQYVWAIMGALDSVTGAMQSLALSKLQAEGGLVILLMQSAIPLSMIITRMFLGTQYKAHHYMGACIVGVGIVLALIPKV